MAESSTPKWMLWAGRVLSALPVLGLSLSAFMKISKNSMAVEGFAKGGWPAGTLVPIGVVELLCAIVYVVPRTAVLGAILVTGYLGGAVATHVHAGEPPSAALILGIFAWAGLFARDPRIRALIPLRKPE